MIRSLFHRIANKILINGPKTQKHTRFVLAVLLGLTGVLDAQSGVGSTPVLSECLDDSEPTFGALASFIFAILKGGFGALIMVVSGIAAILSAAFGQYRAALSALVVALGVFVLQIFVGAFFDFEVLNECSTG